MIESPIENFAEQNYKSNRTCRAYSIINHEMSYDRITHRKFCRAKFEGNIN